ncbi:MAG: SDR family oxidoreductase [Proteobacteria bacterium]|nr:SDR family oxidoreductase [Pseudomonadota bacterium]
MPTVLITGASRGLGLEFARQYAADGWRVIATCRDPAGAAALGQVAGEVLIETLDVDSDAAVGALARDLKDEAIDLLVNNAGIFGPQTQALDGLDYDAWARVFRTNAMAPIRMAAAFQSQVAKSGLKTIATVTSQMGSIGDNDAGGDYIYRSSKAAVNAAVKSLAVDVQPLGIKVALLHPGWVRTDMGSEAAPLAVEESVEGLIREIDKLHLEHTGCCKDHTGETIPW